MTTARRRTAEVAPAWRELWALACAMRPEGTPGGWDRQDTGQVIRAAMTAGWSFEAVAVEVWRLVWDEHGEPAELRNTLRKPIDRTPTDPDTGKRGLATVMAAIEEGRQARDQDQDPGSEQESA